MNALTAELQNLQRQQPQCNKIEIQNCRKRNLIARKEMLLWDKLCQKSKCDIIVKQMSSLQMQLEFQRKNLYDSLRQEMLELAAAGQIEYHRLMAIEECDDITFGLCKQFEIIDNYLPGNQLPPSIQKDVSAPEMP